MTKTFAAPTACDVCGVYVSNAGFAARSHERGAYHIAALRQAGRNERADWLQAQADAVKALNQHRRANGTYGYKR